MEGPNLDQARSVTSDSGILPRAVDFIFKEIQRLQVQGNSIDLQMSCMEIYNENLTDLLAAPESGNMNTSSGGQTNSSQFAAKDKQKEKEKDAEKDNSRLAISFNGNKVTVSGLTWVPVKDTQQLFTLVSRASKTRVTDKTSWNEKYKVNHFPLLKYQGLQEVIAYTGSS